MIRTSDQYEQMELDTRRELDIVIDNVALDAITDAQALTQRCGERPTAVRNRHEAYGIAAEHFSRINKAAHSIKADMTKLLGTLSDVNLPAIEAVSDICNSMESAVCVTVKAAAEMKRTLTDLYAAEDDSGEPTPMERLADGGPEYETPPESDSQNPEESEENMEE